MAGPIYGEGDSAVSEAAAQVGGGAPGQDPSFPHPWLLRALSWDVGAAWSWGEGADKVTFAITPKRAFAGITGAWGEWKDADGGGSEYCVNPNVPLALYLKLITDDKNYMEYVLTECGGF